MTFFSKIFLYAHTCMHPHCCSFTCKTVGPTLTFLKERIFRHAHTRMHTLAPLRTKWLYVKQVYCYVLTTTKSEKSRFFLHVPALRFLRLRQLVYLFPIVLSKLRFLWVCKIWDNFVKKFICQFCLIKVRI